MYLHCGKWSWRFEPTVSIIRSLPTVSSGLWLVEYIEYIDTWIKWPPFCTRQSQQVSVNWYNEWALSHHLNIVWCNSMAWHHITTKLFTCHDSTTAVPKWKISWQSLHYNLDVRRIKFPSSLIYDGKLVCEISPRRTDACVRHKTAMN